MIRSAADVVHKLQENNMCPGYYAASRTLMVLNDFREQGHPIANELQQRFARAAEEAGRYCTAEVCGFEDNAHLDTIVNEVVNTIPSFPSNTSSGDTLAAKN